jgi:anti-sigma regulatory factor (Ser/Thr protein kinase)
VESLRQPSHECVTVSEEADVGALRRIAARCAERLGADDSGRGRAELVASELATNLLRHAVPGGWGLIRPIPPTSVEIMAVDHGPGIADVAAALGGHRDGWVARAAPEGRSQPWRNRSDKGLGCGLATVRRASARFDVHSRPGIGTAVLAVVDVDRATAGRPAPARLWGGVSIPMNGACGDGWAGAETADHVAMAVVDGLGHGPHASLAAEAALSAFAADPADVSGYVARANEATRDTRGAAVAMCLLRREVGELDYVSVGNISGRIYSQERERGLVSYGGTVGTQASPPTARVTTYKWPTGGRLVLWTDGLTSRIDLVADPDLMSHDPAVTAAVLHRQHARGRDDATVVVLSDPGVP